MKHIDKDVLEYIDEYRSYVKDCINDDNFDLTTMEDWQTWLEEEKEEQIIRCSVCGSLNTVDDGKVKTCEDCGVKSKVTKKNKGNWQEGRINNEKRIYIPSDYKLCRR